MAAKKVQVLNDIFEVLEIDPDGKKFDKVSRIRARSDLFEMDMLLDVNVDIYPVDLGDKLALCLATTLNTDGTPSGASYDSVRPTARRTLADDFEYVMHGKIFKFKDSSSGGQVRAEVFVSFGGLLMQLIGDPKRLADLDVDEDIFLLLKKV
ncbi:RPB8 [Auxenochlorella protothecoides x Auxenochlorella symbiontica]